MSRLTMVFVMALGLAGMTLRGQAPPISTAVTVTLTADQVAALTPILGTPQALRVLRMPGPGRAAFDPTTPSPTTLQAWAQLVVTAAAQPYVQQQQAQTTQRQMQKLKALTPAKCAALLAAAKQQDPTIDAIPGCGGGQ